MALFTVLLSVFRSRAASSGSSKVFVVRAFFHLLHVQPVHRQKQAVLVGC